MKDNFKVFKPAGKMQFEFTDLIAGYVSSPVVPLIVGVVLLLGVLFFLRGREGSYRVPDAANVNQTAAE